MLASVIIRTYCEEKYLDKLLTQIRNQKCELVDLEVVIVDSGSTDGTLRIAESHNCEIIHIKKSEFTFGRSLNIGCRHASGDILVFISGHCIPVDDNWLDELCKPLINGAVSYSYGRQVGKDTTKYSEYCHFNKWFPEYSKIPQDGYFCNNANAAITRKAWNKITFDEELTGLEDMHLAKQLVQCGEKIGYVSEAGVFHIHDESWEQLCLRYEREAYALHRIMPEVHFTFYDFVRYFLSGVKNDCISALREKIFLKKFHEIILFRFYHYWGTYKGSKIVRKISAQQKRKYFYPKDLEKESYYEKKNCRFIADESQQRESQR